MPNPLSAPSLSPNERVSNLFNSFAQMGAVFPKDAKECNTIVDDMLLRHAFVRDPVKAIGFLFSLAGNGDQFSLDTVVHALNADDMVIDLIRDKNLYDVNGNPSGIAQGQPERLMHVIRKLPPDRQAQVFAAPNNVFFLADKGYADEIMGMIQKFPLFDQKVAALSAPHAAMGLAKHGHVGALLSAVKECKRDEEKASILSAANTVFGIAEYGTPEERDELVAIIRDLSPPYRADVLASTNAVAGLAMKGKGDDVLQIIETLDPPLQDKVLKAPRAAIALKNAGFEDRIVAVIANIAQFNQNRVALLTPSPH